MSRRRSVLATGVASLLLASPATISLAQAPVTASGLPPQIVPSIAEMGAPTFQAGAGMSWDNPSASTGSSTSPSTAVGLGGTGPTNGATAAIGGGDTVTYTNPDGTTTTLSGGSLAWRNPNRQAHASRRLLCGLAARILLG